MYGDHKCMGSGDERVAIYSNLFFLIPMTSICFDFSVCFCHTVIYHLHLNLNWILYQSRFDLHVPYIR